MSAEAYLSDSIRTRLRNEVNNATIDFSTGRGGDFRLSLINKASFSINYLRVSIFNFRSFKKFKLSNENHNYFFKNTSAAQVFIYYKKIIFSFYSFSPFFFALSFPFLFFPP